LSTHHTLGLDHLGRREGARDRRSSAKSLEQIVGRDAPSDLSLDWRQARVSLRAIKGVGEERLSSTTASRSMPFVLRRWPKRY
jgi:hypothetical protein